MPLPAGMGNSNWGVCVNAGEETTDNGLSDMRCASRLWEVDGDSRTSEFPSVSPRPRGCDRRRDRFPRWSPCQRRGDVLSFNNVLPDPDILDCWKDHRQKANHRVSSVQRRNTRPLKGDIGRKGHLSDVLAGQTLQIRFDDCDLCLACKLCLRDFIVPPKNCKSKRPTYIGIVARLKDALQEYGLVY